jgi:3'(2'), 5'-bisphosphate nucleotidase
MQLTNKTLLDELLPQVCRITYEAGQKISGFYHQDDEVSIEHKQDGSPVTAADQAADRFICQELKSIDSEIPMVTEESVAGVPFDERKSWQTYWLVDPLDGTKEFITGTGEYSVNIALIHQHHPVLGVVYGPESGDFYVGLSASLDDSTEIQIAKKIAGLQLTDKPFEFDWTQQLNDAQPVNVAEHPEIRVEQNLPFRVAVSRRHGAALQHFMGQLGNYTKVKMGSALKTCLVAEGKADIYPRFGPTSLWDTAAAQCVLEAAGGAVLNAAGHPLEYVQTESLLNPFFIAVGHEDYDWPKFPEIL